ncbi:MAG: trypsin [Bacteroidetes bacterium]|nr:MAG: trypsin [Bacteroidota bacterium]
MNTSQNKRTVGLQISSILIILFTILGLVSITDTGSARSKSESVDKTLSPYFFIDSDDPSTDKLPLKSTEAKVNIAGVIADVIITQEYKNEGTNVIEAIYVFPASTRAAVYSMEMRVGDRTLIAKVEEREKARKDYELAKAQGKTASLLEQNRPNVFQMNVANILPGDRITVILKYTETLIPENGVYEFVYPTVVGPRYTETSEMTASTSDLWVANPYMKDGIETPYTFDLKATINASMPIKDVRCTSHEVNVNFDGPATVALSLKSSERLGGNRDFILRYRLTGNQIQTGLLLFKGKTENFFLAMIQPPKRVAVAQIPPREYIFIVDVSGSMNGFPLDITKELMRNLLGDLRLVDKFNVILFAGGSTRMAPNSIPATQANISKAINVIENQRGGGGTRLLPAIQDAIDMGVDDSFSRTIIIATDGYVSVEKKTFDLIRNNLSDANVFAFGIGSSVNRYIIEGMARVGQGTPFIITKPKEAKAQAAKFKKYVDSPVLTNIKVSYNGFTAYDVEPITIPDVFAEKPVLIYGKWRGSASGTIDLKGQNGLGEYTASLKVKDASLDAANSALRYLWARNQIAMLDDYNHVTFDEEIKKEVINLGLNYNLLTAYTSFVAIDSEVRNKDGKIVSVKQPLPLPDGVSNLAVGGNTSFSYGSRGKPAGSYARSHRLRKESKKDYSSSSADFSESLEVVALEEETFSIIERMPEFPGGQAALAEFLKKHIAYPASEKLSAKEGIVYISFIVGKDGAIKSIKILRGVSEAFDKEALRVVKLMPKWTPGERRGSKVDVNFTLPIKFKMNS